ncbi:MAG: hypothetical protein AB1349_07870 [Elusimicrobiota bacterium]
MSKRAMDCKYLGTGHLDEKTPCWICKREFIGRGTGEIIRDRPIMEIHCRNCSWYEKADRGERREDSREKSREGLPFFLLFAILYSLFAVFTGCERHKDRREQSPLEKLIVGSEPAQSSVANLTQAETEAIVDIFLIADMLKQLMGGEVYVPEQPDVNYDSDADDSESSAVAKTPPTAIPEDFLRYLKKLYRQRQIKIGISGGGLLGILTFAYTFMELTSTTGESDPLTEIYESIKRGLTDQQLQKLYELKADPDGWFLENLSSAYGLAVYSRIILVSGQRVQKFEDLVKAVEKNPNRANRVKTLEMKIISGGVFEIYIGIESPASDTPTILFEMSIPTGKILSAHFKYDKNRMWWQGATITKYYQGYQVSYTPTSSGVNWLIENETSKLHYQFSWDGLYWRGSIKTEAFLDRDGDGKGSWETIADISESGPGLLSVLYFMSNDWFPVPM